MNRVAVGLRALVAVMALAACGSEAASTPSGVAVTVGGGETPSPATVIKVQGTSMTPTLQEGVDVSVDLEAYAGSAPQRGDVVLLNAPVTTTNRFIKRVIGLPGDRIEIGNTAGNAPSGVFVFVMPSGSSGWSVLSEPYLAPIAWTVMTWCCTVQGKSTGYGPAAPVTIPANQYFVLSDNRNGSEDSRIFGFIARNSIVGRVQVVATASSLTLLPALNTPAPMTGQAPPTFLAPPPPVPTTPVGSVGMTITIPVLPADGLRPGEIIEVLNGDGSVLISRATVIVVQGGSVFMAIPTGPSALAVVAAANAAARSLRAVRISG